MLTYQAAVEALQAIYSRQSLEDDEFLELVCPMYAPERINMFTNVYSWSIAPPVRDLQAGGTVTFNSANVDVPRGGRRLSLTFGPVS